MSLKFKELTGKRGINKILKFDAGAAGLNLEIKWTPESLKKYTDEGWQIYTVLLEDSANDIVAVVFTKEENGALLTLNTPIKMAFQGNGYSHMIKSFYEDKAKNSKIKKIVSYCRPRRVGSCVQ